MQINSPEVDKNRITVIHSGSNSRLGSRSFTLLFRIHSSMGMFYSYYTFQEI